ncbi:MAG: tyrosine-type recombinase/integrase [Rectinemataceae bacterium]|nr:tyrosine-type recombinase/integrase [Rectinemataceae bacterium]
MNKNNGSLFFDYVNEFLHLYLPRQQGRSPHTVKSYGDCLSLFRRYAKDVHGISIFKLNFPEVNRDFILGFLEWLSSDSDGVKADSPSTRNQRLACIKSYMRFSADKNVSLSSLALQVHRIPPCKAPKPAIQAMSEEAIAAILRQPPNTKMGLRDRTFMILLYDSGARVSEIINLKVGDLSLDDRSPQVRLEGKGKKTRTVPIMEKTVEHLRQYIRVYHKAFACNVPQLFYTVIKGNAAPMSVDNVARFIDKYSMMAGMNCREVPENVHPHLFRHSRATHLHQSGVELAIISRFLGHANMDTSRIYAIPSIEMLREAVEKSRDETDEVEKPNWLGDEDKKARLCGIR